MYPNTTNDESSFDAMEVLVSCGIPPCLGGCAHLARAIDLYADGMTSFMEIYRTIAKERGVEVKSALRTITYALKHSFDLHVNLSELLHITIPKDQVHSSLVIAQLGLYMRRRNQRK